MTVPTFVGSSTGAVVTTTAATAHAITAAIGDLIIWQILTDGAGGQPTITSPSNISTVDGRTSGLANSDFLVPSQLNPASHFHHLYAGWAIGTTPSLTFTTGGADMYIRAHRFSGLFFGSHINAIIENLQGTGGRPTGHTTGTTNTINAPTVETSGPDRLGVCFIACNDDNPVAAFTGETGGDWTEPVAEFASATGTDGMTSINTATLSSAGTISGGSITMAASDNWSCVAFALIPNDMQVPPPELIMATDRYF